MFSMKHGIEWCINHMNMHIYLMYPYPMKVDDKGENGMISSAC